MSALFRLLVDFDLEAPPASPSAASGWDLEEMTGSLVESDEPSWPDEALPEPLADELAFEPDFAEPDFAEPAIDPNAEAVAAALAEAEARHADQLAALEAAHAESLAAERARWAAEEGARFVDGLGRVRAEIEEALAEAAAAVLEPFLAERVREAAITDLRQAVADLVVSGTAASIAVAGPADILAALRTALAAEGVEDARIEFAETEAAEVTVTADASTIQTRLGAWTQALQRRLGDPQ